MNKIINIILIVILSVCVVACKNKGVNSLKNPKEYVGIYDGEFGGYLELEINGRGTYCDKGAKAGKLTWFVDNYQLSVSADTLNYEIHADVHSFNNMLYFISNNHNWRAERFNKRK